MTDRRVHARTPRLAEIVRYDRAGKWYLEWPGDREWSAGRAALSLEAAAQIACEPGVQVRLGVPGGLRFDARVTAIREGRG